MRDKAPGSIKALPKTALSLTTPSPGVSVWEASLASLERGGVQLWGVRYCRRPRKLDRHERPLWRVHGMCRLGRIMLLLPPDAIKLPPNRP